MFRILILDDRDDDRAELERLVKNSGLYSADMEIVKYSSGIDLLEELHGQVDLFLTDMQMQGMSGYETAKEFREKYPKTVLGFCSAVVAPQPEHFELLPFRYLVKTAKEEERQRITDELLAEMLRKKNKKHLELTQDGKAISIEPDEILYISKLKRGSDITLSSKSILFDNPNGGHIAVREKLAEIEADLAGEGFSKPHNSYLVNLTRITSLDGNELLMENGDRLSVSRNCRENFHKEFMNHFTKKYRRS